MSHRATDSKGESAGVLSARRPIVVCCFALVFACSTQACAPDDSRESPPGWDSPSTGAGSVEPEAGEAAEPGDESRGGCAPAQRMCNANAQCIADDACCTSADCSLAGQVCPQAGGACQCPDGERMCTAIHACISAGECCTSADCTALAGSTCAVPGQACRCASGEKPCAVMGWCIPQASCCPLTSCPPFVQPE
jgi:hypothetical protein